MANETEGFLNNLPDVSFIDGVTLDDIQAQMVTDYEKRYKELTGQEIKLKRADPVTLLLYACSIQIYQTMLFVDRAGKQDLLKYSYGEYLDNLAAYKGIMRNEEKEAKTTVRFTLSEVQRNAISIAAGTRVTNGEIYFATDEYAEIKIGEMTVDVPCTCLTAGASGNHLLAGDINTLVDQIAYIDSVENITESTGGSDVESDASLAERVYYAPASYSTAGPEDAYIEHVKSYSQLIGDVSVYSPEDTFTVEIRFLMSDGSMPSQEIIDGLSEYLSSKTLRPLTDHVIVESPKTVDYNIDITYFISRSDIEKAVTIQQQVQNAVNEFNLWQTTKIGRDINPSELIKRVILAGAKRCEIKDPQYAAVPSDSVARLAGMTLIYGGAEGD